jgi:hypothetical protein
MLSMMMLSMVAVEVAMFVGREDWMETMLIVVVVMVVSRGEWEAGGVWDGEESDRWVLARRIQWVSSFLSLGIINVKERVCAKLYVQLRTQASTFQKCSFCIAIDSIDNAVKYWPQSHRFLIVEFHLSLHFAQPISPFPKSRYFGE